MAVMQARTAHAAAVFQTLIFAILCKANIWYVALATDGIWPLPFAKVGDLFGNPAIMSSVTLWQGYTDVVFVPRMQIGLRPGMRMTAGSG